MASSRRTRRRSVRVRAATLADAGAIARVMRAAIRALPRGTYTDRQRAAWASLPALYHAWAMTAGGERYAVAVRGGRIAGYAARRGAELTAAFVHPRAAGRGVGAALVARVERDAARAGVRRLSVLAARSAVPFYAALGYGGGRAVRVPLPGGGALPSRRLAKRLAPPGPAAQSRPQGRRNGQRRQAARSSRSGKASSRATLRAGSESAPRMAAIDARISPRQRSRVSGSAATETRSAGAPASPTR